MRKRHLFPGLLLIGVLLHLTSIDSYSSFLIGFKNGRRIYVAAYRIEGGEMLLYFNSGLLKVAQSEVDSILEEKDEPLEDKTEEIGEPQTAAREVTGPPEGRLPERRTPEANTAGTPSIKQNEAIEHYRKKKAEISEKLEEAKKNYFEASDRSDKERTRKAMVSASREMFALEEEVTKGNGGLIPDWWRQQ